MCTRPITTPNSLYISGSGFSARPSHCSVMLMTPRSPSTVIQAKVRTTMPVSSGAITAISSSAWPTRECIRAIQCASG